MPQLALHLLGTFQASLHGISITTFETHKVRALLTYLAVEADRPHARDELIGLLWPDQPEQAARASLRQALANLRKAIGDRTIESPFLDITSDSIQFRRSSSCWIDVVAFTELMAVCQSHPHRQLAACRSCARRLQQAVELYRGDFLAQFHQGGEAFGEWLLLKRERLHQAALDALYALAEHHDRRGEYDREQHYARRQLELDPWREEAHRQVMRALALSGQRSAALAQYEACRRVLKEELSVEPVSETVRLYERIRDGSSEDDRPAVATMVRLPASPTPLVGRECVIAELVELVEDPAHRLVTITGPGGIGKTRLAMAIGCELAYAFRDGVTFVSLAALNSIDFLAPTILTALEIPLDGQVEAKVQLHSYLRHREMLLIIDNWEHLLPQDGGVELLAEMLQGAPGLAVLATSRERLAMQAEWQFDLQGLDYSQGASSTDLQTSSAVQLFLQRARQAQRCLTIDQTDFPAIARICQLVEGLPLAIELAAASVGVQSCAQIADEITAGLRTLTSRFRDTPERHRSVWAAFEHSWNLLTEQERGVLRRVSVFRGGWEAEAAAQVAGAALNTLTALVDKSLLRRKASGRFDMHELVRQYAGEKLHEAGEVEHTCNCHLNVYLEVAQVATLHLMQMDQIIWLARLNTEKDNLRAAMQWALGQQDAVQALKLGEALRRFWQLRGHLIEGRQWLARTIDMARGQGATTPEYTRAYAKVLIGAGELAFAQSDVTAARTFFEESLSYFRELDDKKGVAASLNNLARIASIEGDKDLAQSLYVESLTLLQELGDHYAEAWLYYNLGLLTVNTPDEAKGVELFQKSNDLFRHQGDRRGSAWSLKELAYAYQRQGRYEQAAEMLEESLGLFRQLEDRQGMAYVLNSLGEYWRFRGDMIRADELYTECLGIFREVGDKRGAAWLQANRAQVACLCQDHVRACALFTESLDLARQVNDRHSMASSLAGLAEVWRRLGQTEHAVRLLSAAEAMLISIGQHLDYADQTSYDQSVSAILAQLDKAAFDAAWAKGRALTQEQAIQLALQA